MLLPLDGRRMGRETEADPKQDKDGTHGQEQDRQQTIANSGGKMSRLCEPPGAKRFNIEHERLKFPQRLYVVSFTFISLLNPDGALP